MGNGKNYQINFLGFFGFFGFFGFADNKEKNKLI